jgi:hypothetical protein
LARGDSTALTGMDEPILALMSSRSEVEPNTPTIPSAENAAKPFRRCSASIATIGLLATLKSRIFVKISCLSYLKF